MRVPTGMALKFDLAEVRPGGSSTRRKFDLAEVRSGGSSIWRFEKHQLQPHDNR
jgi:hypothetical protein